jgi:hypothetical protein
LKHIHDRLEQFAGDWNRQFPGVVARAFPAQSQGVQHIQQAAGELGRLIGQTIRPLLPPMRIPVAVQEQEAHALGTLVAGILNQPDKALEISREVDTCIAETLTDLVSGHLLKHAAEKAWR